MDQMELRLSARQAVAQAELMAKEIDHRVTNSLQFISGTLSMQSRGLDRNTASHCRWQQTARSQRSIVHHLLTPTLCGSLRQSWQRKLKWKVIGKEPTTRIQPIGLMLNELIANAAKHGGGNINVEYKIDGGRHELSVCDEGDGLPTFDSKNRGRSRNEGGSHTRYFW
jgi:two-component sensor histidine kinase